MEGSVDLTGQQFEKLTVLSKSDHRKGYWLCRCECGTTKEVNGYYLRSGLTKSCGCLRGKTKAANGRKRKSLPRTKNRIYYEGEAKPNGTTATGVSTHSTGFKIMTIFSVEMRLRLENKAQIGSIQQKQGIAQLSAAKTCSKVNATPFEEICKNETYGMCYFSSEGFRQTCSEAILRKPSSLTVFGPMNCLMHS